MQSALFAQDEEPLDLGDPDAVVTHTRAFLGAADADRLFSALVNEVPWAQHEITLYGRTHPVPRLESWHGDPGRAYTYSGRRLEPEPWSPSLTELRERLASVASFNSVLCNLYRTGTDKVGWHADDEPELGSEPVIASVSLGATRRFRLRPRSGGVAVALDLTHGSLVVMSGATQARFVHELSATKLPDVGARINLTFRTIV